MILQELVHHYETLAEEGMVSRPGWCSAKVSYALNIDKEGTLCGLIFLKQERASGKKTSWVPQMIEVPEMVSRSSGVSANFLCDNSKYMLGIDMEGARQRNIDCFKATKEKHLSVLEEVHSETAEAVKNFFRNWKPEEAANNEIIQENWDEITAGSNLIFYVNNGRAQDDFEVRTAWEKSIQSEESGPQGVCLVTGVESEIARIHATIRGVQGAQSSGAALVSFNASAFESYGKEQSYNAPVGKYAAFAYTTALNYLLSQRDYICNLGDTTVVYWSADGQEIYQRAFMDAIEPQLDNQEVLKSIFHKLHEGEPIDLDGIELDPEQKFCILGLAPNAARLSIRFFYEDHFGNILSHLQEHYNRMEIVRPSLENQDFVGVWRMLNETTNQKSKDKKPLPNMAALLMTAILSGGRYPENLYSNILIRIRAEQGNVGYRRAGIIKAYLIRNKENQFIKEGSFVGLNEKCRNTAYLLGRDFAILEAIQQKANPTINATIKDRYFNSACATPASIFPVLFKLKESHIRKLEPGMAIHFEKMLTEIQGMIEVKDGQVSPYPRRLLLEEQGMFILGYYHQTQKRYEKKEDK